MTRLRTQRSLLNHALLALFAVFAWSLSVAQAEVGQENAQAKKGFELAEAAISQGRAEEAKTIIARIPRTTEYAQVYGRFLDGRLAEATGRLTTARDIYRAILDEHPDLARVRLHLARTLAALTDADASRRHFDFLLGGADIDAGLAERIRTDRQAIDRIKRWSASAYVTIAPSSNYTSGAATSAFSIGDISFTPDDASRKRSGLGAIYGMDAAYLAPFADDWGWLVTLSALQRDYPHVGFDDGTLTTTAGVRYLVPDGVVTMELVAARRWFGGARYQFAIGPRVSMRTLVDDQTRVTLVASVLAQRNDERDYQDGRRTNLSASLDRFTLPGQFFRIGANYEVEHTRAAHLTYREWSVFAGYNMELPFALTAYPELSVARRPYAGDFPFMSSPRFDRRQSASLTLVKKDLTLFGLAPRLNMAFVQNRSNVGLYRYDKLEGGLTMTRDF